MTSNSTDEDSYDSSSGSENEYSTTKKEYRKCKFCGKFFFLLLILRMFIN